MLRKIFFSSLFLFAALLLAGAAWYWLGGVREELDRPADHTRLVFRFEGPLDDRALATCADVWRARLRSINAIEFSVERNGEREVELEFRPWREDENHAHADMLRLLSAQGMLRFLRQAEAQDFNRAGTTLETESAKVEAWRDAHADEPIDTFDRLAPEAGGPVPKLQWYPRRQVQGETGRRPVIPLVEPKDEWVFRGRDLASASYASDDRGQPALGFELVPQRAPAFGDFTESIVNRGLAIVIDGEVVTLATVQARLPGSGLVNGGVRGFTLHEVRDLIALLRAGELPAKPALVSEMHVTASRGAIGWPLALVSFASAIAALAMIWMALRTMRKPRVSSEPESTRGGEWK